MARIYQALQRQSDQRFDMTVSSDEEGWTHAIGYCSGWPGDKPPDDNTIRKIWWSLAAWKKHIDRIEPFHANYHRDGHETRAEAEACYTKYQLDNELRLDGHDESQQKKCVICSEWTQGRAALLGESFREFVLCDAHRTREHIEQLINSHRVYA